MSMKESRMLNRSNVRRVRSWRRFCSRRSLDCSLWKDRKRRGWKLGEEYQRQIHRRQRGLMDWKILGGSNNSWLKIWGESFINYYHQDSLLFKKIMYCIFQWFLQKYLLFCALIGFLSFDGVYQRQILGKIGYKNLWL